MITVATRFRVRYPDGTEHVIVMGTGDHVEVPEGTEIIPGREPWPALRDYEGHEFQTGIADQSTGDDVYPRR